VKKPLAILCIGLSLTGCAGKGTPPAADNKPIALPPDTVATVNGTPISADQLHKPLVEAYGLNMLFNLAKLEVAKQTAARNKVVVTEADFEQEMDQSIATMFAEGNAKALADIEAAQAKGDLAQVAQLRKDLKADNSQLLDQFLEQQRTSRVEFETVIRTNAYLRKIIEPTLAGAITDQKIEEGFRFQYGEKVLVRHIQCANWAEIAEAKKMLADNISFADVAKAVSRNARTAPLGGELRPFSRAEPSLGETFKNTAFALKEGEISEPVNSGNAFHLIKLEKRIPPTAVKLEDVKESVRKSLYDGLLANGIKQLRGELNQDTLRVLKINDPVLKAQFDKRSNAAKSQVQGRDEMRKKLTEEREAAEKSFTTQPTTAPGATTPSDAAAATMPASVPATTPASK